MKRYDELTHEELVALTETDIERLVELEIAHAGIISETAFQVAGMLFKNESDAIAVARNVKKGRVPVFNSERYIEVAAV